MSTRRSSRGSGDQKKGSSGNLTPEQMQELTEKVYALMLRDLKIGNERQRFMDKTRPNTNRQWGR